MGSPAESRKASKLRSKLQATIELAQEQQKRELYSRRIDIAKSGVRAYENGKLAEAAKAFHTYLQILENYKGTSPGGLMPSHFDVKNDLSELLLISAVYWDLVKLYDRTKTESKRGEFNAYMNKYIGFCKGLPHQALCAEALRKYIRNDKAAHRQEFKKAYETITGGSVGCFVATSLADVCDPMTLPRLRIFRDDVLLKRAWGESFVQWYYRSGPGISLWVDELPDSVRRSLGAGLDVCARSLVGIFNISMDDRSDS